VKRYEGLFILNNAGREEGVKEILDQVTEEINKVGGRVETVQKMDRRNFARVSDHKTSAGFYVNVIFQTDPSTLAQLRTRFAGQEEIFRVLFTVAPPPGALLNEPQPSSQAS